MTRRRASRPATSVSGAEGVSPAAGGFEILESKLIPPPLREGIVERSALVDRLASMHDTPIVAILAPAGYGKSSILAQWATRDSRPFLWVSIDRRDNDPAILLTYVARAVERASPRGSELAGLLAAPHTSIWASAVPRVARALASIARPFVLVLDDADKLTEPSAADIVVTLAEHLPSGSQLVIAGRTAGRFPIPRLAAAGRIAVIGAEDLALSDAEASSVLRAAGVVLEQDDVASINRHAEGWAAGVYLTALAMLARGITRPPTVTGALAGGLVTDYIRAEILDGLEPADVDFMLRTSVLDRFSAPLCDEVVGRTDSAGRLERLGRSNLLLIPTDDRREWYRYHDMLREHLSFELERRYPGSVASLIGRAGEWHESRGDHGAAFEYALAASDLERASRLFVGLAQRTYNAGRVETTRRWCEALDALGAPARYPDVAATGAVMYASQGHIADAERWARLADEGTGGQEEAMPRPMVAFARSMLCRSGIEAMAADAAYAVEQWNEDAPFRPGALNLLGVAQAAMGDPEAERTLGAAALAAQPGHRAQGTAAIAFALRATLAMARGDWEAAEGHAGDARAALGAVHGEQMSGGVVDAVAARVALHHGERARARELLAHAARLRPLLSSALPWIAIRARLDLAHAHLAMADPAGARILVAEINDILHVRPRMGTLVEEHRSIQRQLATNRGSVPGVSSLTVAELRLLPWLATHLAFGEIGERLFVSKNTVKSQVASIYRKLDANSRSEAIDRAVEVGLLESMGRFTPPG
jgi:LuxR family transcriptional regulator, maltose regulon positive regulatory protein